MRRFIIVLIIGVIGCSCSILTEEDLSGTYVNVLLPVEDFKTDTNEVLFWWDHVEEALDYSLQIVEGSFESPVKLVLDSVIIKNTFNINIDKGDYSWRIRSANYYSVGEWSEGQFTVIDTSSIVAKKISLSSE